MSVFPTGLQIRESLYGLIVQEPAKNIPQTNFSNIFTVSGGRVLLTSLVGQVTTAIGATATTISVGVTPTGGSLAAAAIATATAITSAAVGTLVSVAMPVGALVVGAVAGTGVLALGGSNLFSTGSQLLVSPGVINISTSANDTGAMSWTCTYIPYDTGATVTAV
jgi:hypothetical protein